MPLIIALLKINITLTVCYLLFYLLLRRLTFYNLNRLFFLSVIALGMLMPFIHIRLSSPATVMPAMLSSATRYTLPEVKPEAFNVVDVLQLAFWAGFIFMGIRLLVRLGSIGMLYSRSQKMSAGGTVIRVMTEDNNPFSFFKSIFINPGQLSRQELDMVLAHENVHTRQWHSIDILLGELCKTVCWFNPVTWLMTRAMKQNLEFIADREVLKKGTASKAYQYSLLRVSQSGSAVALTNNFNFSNLKTRIIMMNKKQSASIHLAKYLAAGPLALALICCFGLSQARQQKAQHEKLITRTGNQEDTRKTSPEKTGLTEDKTMTGAKPQKIKSVHLMQTQNPVSPEAKRPATAILTLKSGATRKFESSRSAEERAANDKPKPLVIVDGEKMSLDAIRAISPEDIESVTVLTDASAIQQYGDEGKNGVLLIVKKKK